MFGARKSGVLRRVSGNMFTFQQNSTPAHRAWDMTELLRRFFGTSGYSALLGYIILKKDYCSM